MSLIEIRTESQLSPVGDEVSALVAVIRPILQGLLYALKQEVVAEVGGFNNVKLMMLPRMYRAGDGDIGICFEYAVHDAIKRGEPSVVEKVNDGMRRHCKVKGNETSSILFGAEKNGALRLIDTAKELLTDDSRLLTGAQAQPVKLRRYINLLAAAFRRPTTRLYLPASISGAWKADLFLGMKDTDRWVGTSVKTNAAQLEGATGIRVGIVPSHQGKSDKITFDAAKNLVICPLPYDGAFTEVFYSAWVIVQQFIAADAQIPKEAALPSTSQRMVAKLLAERRAFPIVDVVEVLRPIAQPELLVTTSANKPVEPRRAEAATVETLIAPISRIVGVNG